MKGTLHKYLCTLIIVPLRILLKIRNISVKKNLKENRNSPFKFKIIWQFGGDRQATDGKTAYALCVMDIQSCRHTDYEILIAFPQQKLLHERA